MANPDTPFGFRPVGTLNGSPWNAGLRRIQAIASYGTALFIGDPVIWTGDSDATGECPIVQLATAGKTNKITGVIVGWEPDPNYPSYTYRPASTLRFGWMLPANDSTIYEIQASTDAVLALGTVGLQGVIVKTHAGSTVTGLSGVELDSGAADNPDAHATGQVTIIGAVKRQNNDITAVHAKWLVTINLPSISAGIAGV